MGVVWINDPIFDYNDMLLAIKTRNGHSDTIQRLFQVDISRVNQSGLVAFVVRVRCLFENELDVTDTTATELIAFIVISDFRALHM